jgi:sulfatase maturation enzyme AslB (radical SAM superfamily)
MTDKVFCLAPWSNLEILPTGSILPCCKFQIADYPQKFNITSNTIKEYMASDTLAEIKNDFLHGQWPRGCERCRIEESNNIKSKRELDRERWAEHYNNYDLEKDNLLTLSFALGNVCNLKCIICGPHASSLWSKEYKDIYGIEIQSIESFRKEAIDDLANHAPNLVHMDIHGGEPFLANKLQHRQLLDKLIDNNQAQSVTIHYTSNGTIWPDLEWIERWKYFKEVDIQLSIDGVGKKFEYIRYPADWNVLQQNVQKYLQLEKQNSNFRLSVSHTVSAFNILYLDEFVTWCKQTGLPEPWMGKLHNPQQLRPTVWPGQTRQFIVDKLQQSSYSNIHAWANLLKTSDDSQQFCEFQHFVKTHDQYRNLDFKQVFPELADHI